ncbi:hypothetical protein AVEN_84747-1 [Araneus ventricosus]|uniref:DUF4817 domain-containing protein n=1 Tax=Araneus ventricosus TaxID=182803 RepID=A0A4Y2Q725_ARAVE|nr:hypothetical protein AVEN_84747-1 [Araneus ventricosus]
MRTTRFTCYKNAGYSAFLHFASEKFAMTVSLKDCALLVKLFYKNNDLGTCSSAKVPDTQGPMTVQGLLKMIQKFEKTGSFSVQSGRGRKRIDSTVVEEVAGGVERWCATVQCTGNCPTIGILSTVHKILRNILHCYPYKISHVQELRPSDLPARETFALEFLARMELPWKIVRTDKAHFHLTGYVNTQNCRIWATENPLETQLVPLRPAKVTVWCGFTASFIMGPYFFEETGALDPVTITVTGQRYECLLRNHVIPALQQLGYVDRIIFMQDGAPPHIANPVKQLLKRHFGTARIISRHFPTAWPFRSPDLNPCDSSLWGYLTDVVFSTPIAHLVN